MTQPNHYNGDTRRTGDDFRISNGPVSPSGLLEPFDLPELAPFSGPGAPFLCAIPRDPRSVFVYWQIDWPSAFGCRKPADRQVHLRLHRDDSVESSTAVEPMAGNAYLEIARPGGSYRIEIGFYEPEQIWNSVATSDEVTAPVDGAAENEDVDLATIPLHLSFQRLIDLFRAQNGDALAEIIARLQKRAVSEDERALLTPEDWEILSAMDVSIEEFAAARNKVASSMSSQKIRQRAEAVLGFGGTSPGGGFSGSSWS